MSVFFSRVYHITTYLQNYTQFQSDFMKLPSWRTGKESTRFDFGVDPEHWLHLVK